ncbi:hypothetical protein EZV62_000632 [Acer yangbiense]|uniref:Pentatricopeptide repeat-containing protein n=1 Tax=Acer yangbiense TaxID=1000413 RepID=A0A5C7IRP0_9ROSI|nr:hypothetical protein EZV62_000632 [Acer yangbiense]
MVDEIPEIELITCEKSKVFQQKSHTYTWTLVYGLCSNSRLEEAFKFKEDMTRVYNVWPNGHIYVPLIKGGW